MSQISVGNFAFDRLQQLFSADVDIYVDAYIDPETEEYIPGNQWQAFLDDVSFTAGGNGSESDFAQISVALSTGLHQLRIEASHPWAGGETASWHADLQNMTLAEFGQLVFGYDEAPGSTHIDVVFGSEYDDEYNMGRNGDYIEAAAGNDKINGGTGADTMLGGAGNDTYYIDSSFDIVNEIAAGSDGIDTVRSSNLSINLNYTSRFLGNVEHAVLEGTGAFNLTGNGLNNYLQGNSAKNVLDGGSGRDTMVGQAHDDTYHVDSSGDVVDESVAGSSGSDTVRSSNISINLQLANSFKGNVEHAVVGGAANLNITGNALTNYLQGNGGNNIIDGRGGGDTLVGQGGNDTFRFSTSLGITNIDTIADYNVAQDRIELENSYFSALPTGWLYASSFVANTTGLAQDASDRIIYETDTGKLFYDSNGSAAGGTYQQFAQLAVGLSMTAGEFFVT